MTMAPVNILATEMSDVLSQCERPDSGLFKLHPMTNDLKPSTTDGFGWKSRTMEKANEGW